MVACFAVCAVVDKQGGGAMYDAVSRLVLCKQVRDNVMQTKLAIVAATVRL